MYSSLYQKGALCGNDVGSIAFSDHMNKTNNFNKILFLQNGSEMYHLDFSFYPTPLATPKIEVLETMVSYRKLGFRSL